MLTPREPKITDQDQADFIYNILCELRDKYPQFEGAIWVSAMLSAIISSYEETGYTREEFAAEWNVIRDHFIEGFPDK